MNASLGGGGAGQHGESSTRAASQQHSDGDGLGGGPRHVFSALDAVDGDDGEDGGDTLVRMLRVRCALSGKLLQASIVLTHSGRDVLVATIASIMSLNARFTPGINYIGGA